MLTFEEVLGLSISEVCNVADLFLSSLVGSFMPQTTGIGLEALLEL